jgi:hypothetical protein
MRVSEVFDDHGAVWVPVGSDLYYSLAAAEAAATELRSENYSETISEALLHGGAW